MNRQTKISNWLIALLRNPNRGSQFFALLNSLLNKCCVFFEGYQQKIIADHGKMIIGHRIATPVHIKTIFGHLRIIPDRLKIIHDHPKIIPVRLKIVPDHQKFIPDRKGIILVARE